MLDVLVAANNQALFRRWHADGSIEADRTPQYGAFARHYYPVVYGATHHDACFAVVDGQIPLLYVAMTFGEAGLDYYGVPVRFFCHGVPDQAVVARAFEHIDHLIETHKLRRAIIADDDSLGRLSALGRACFNRHFNPSVRLTAWADLSQGEAGLRQGLRKSFKSLLNWGKANMSIEVVDQANPDRAQFDEYLEFHRSVAGKAARPQAVWDALFSWITQGRGELVLGFLEGRELVSATLAVDAATSAYYGVGVYDRQRFDKPMAHWPLWQAMLRAQQRGLARFELGDVPLETSTSPKEIAIGYFKRGFATELATTVDWEWRAADGASA